MDSIEEKRKKWRERTATYRKKHPEKVRAYKKKWNLEWQRNNKEAVAVRNKKWAENNPDSARTRNARRRAKMKGAPGSGVFASDWHYAANLYVGLCVYCTRPCEPTMDHVEPIAGGGAHDPQNIAACCLACNSSKGDLPLLVWLASRPFTFRL